MTPSIRNAMTDLQLDRVVIVHAGRDRFPCAPDVEAIGAAELLSGGGI